MSLKKEFNQKKTTLFEKNKLKNMIFEEKEIKKLPNLLQKYFAYSGYVGKPMMSASTTEYPAVDFLLNGKWIKIKYIQVNSSSTFERLAFIDAKLAKIVPFQGIDDNMEGKGRMHGVLGNLITVFDVTGPEMNQAALVTALAEGLFCPSSFLQKDIMWEEVDQNHLKATLTRYGVTVSGIYEIRDNGEIANIVTNDRYEEMKGMMIRRKWIAEVGDYKKINGVMNPTSVRVSWLDDNKKRTYFEGRDVVISYLY